MNGVALWRWIDREEDNNADEASVATKFEQAARITVHCCPQVKNLCLFVEEGAP